MMISGRICGLALCWTLTLTTTILLTDIGPLSALKIGIPEEYASLTISFYFLGATISSILSIGLFQTLGRFWGFTVGCFFQFLGCICGVLGMISRSPSILLISCFSVGLSQGIGQFYRFVAIDIGKSSGNQGTNITAVLSGGIFAAICGPSLASYSRSWFSADFVGSYLMMGVIASCNQLLLSFISFQQTTESSPSEISPLLPVRQEPSRPLLEIFTQPSFLLACGTATLSNTIMVMVMSQFSLDMNRHNFRFDLISYTLEFHLLAMYSPSFFTGYLFDHLTSPVVLSIIGNILYLMGVLVMCFIINSSGYLVGMILIGIAWNFCYSSSTLMLSESYRPSEAYLVQGVNDTLLMVISGTGSLISGLIYVRFGWIFLLSVIGGLICFCVVLLIAFKVHTSSTL